MWQAKTKDDLIIEVWEKLDCESVGAAEIEAIEIAVTDMYGAAAVDSPMLIARLLADEGADLRHSEIMGLWVERNSDRPYNAALRNILDLKDLKSALTSIHDLENIRRKYAAAGDKEGLRHVRDTALSGKRQVKALVDDRAANDVSRKKINIEIAQWLTVWLQTPTIFDSWVEMRQMASDFKNEFGHIRQDQKK